MWRPGIRPASCVLLGPPEGVTCTRGRFICHHKFAQVWSTAPIKHSAETGEPPRNLATIGYLTERLFGKVEVKRGNAKGYIPSLASHLTPKTRRATKLPEAMKKVPQLYTNASSPPRAFKCFTPTASFRRKRAARSALELENKPHANGLSPSPVTLRLISVDPNIVFHAALSAAIGPVTVETEGFYPPVLQPGGVY